MFHSVKAALVAVALAAGITVTLSAHAQSRSKGFLGRNSAQRARTKGPAQLFGGVTKGGNAVVAQLPDLVIANIDPNRDGTAPRTITVRNQGGLIAPSYSVRVRVYNGWEQLLYQIDIPKPRPLARGESRTFPLFTTAYGERWAVQLDPLNQVREANEKNNHWGNNRER